MAISRGEPRTGGAALHRRSFDGVAGHRGRAQEVLAGPLVRSGATQQVAGHRGQQVVVAHAGDGEQRQHDLQARRGPNACAVATPRLSSTTGDGLIRARPSYRAAIRSQSVSSATGARAWQAAIVGLQGIRTDGAAESLDPVDVRQAALDQQPVPAGAVLVEQ